MGTSSRNVARKLLHFVRLEVYRSIFGGTAPDQPFAIDIFFLGWGTRFPTFFFAFSERKVCSFRRGKVCPSDTWRKLPLGTEKQLASQRGKAPFHRFNGKETFCLPKDNNLAVNMCLWGEVLPLRTFLLSRSAFCSIFLLRKFTLRHFDLWVCGMMVRMLKKKKVRNCILKNLTVFLTTIGTIDSSFSSKKS